MVTPLVALALVLSAPPAGPRCPTMAKDPTQDVGPCDKKPADACLKAGDLLIAQPGCHDEALARYELGCKRDVLRACSKLGFRLVETSRDPAPVKRAIELFTRACDGGDPLGCANLASFTWDGEGVPRDPKKAAVYAEKACRGGDAFGCGTLGSLWAQGELGKKDPAKAFAYFDKACTGGSASGCNQVGMAYAAGEGVKKDLEKAMGIWAKACKERNAAACANLGRAFKAKGDDDNARKASTRACTLGDDEACKEKGLPPPDLEE
jgi:TPR repeat protein